MLKPPSPAISVYPRTLGDERVIEPSHTSSSTLQAPPTKMVKLIHPLKVPQKSMNKNMFPLQGTITYPTKREVQNIIDSISDF